ncbi:MAG TPA: hypothetical protein PKD57_13035, partial [Saprospiraceae bacterium]|nr:hypothetical protein [Saprospiraceae bacterium]
MNNIKYTQATTEHLEDLILSRIDFMTSYWGAQPDTSVRQLRMELREFFEREIPLKTYISWLAHEGEKLAGVGGMKVYQIPGNFRVPNG